MPDPSYGASRCQQRGERSECVWHSASRLGLDPADTPGGVLTRGITSSLSAKPPTLTPDPVRAAARCSSRRVQQRFKQQPNTGHRASAGIGLQIARQAHHTSSQQQPCLEWVGRAWVIHIIMVLPWHQLSHHIQNKSNMPQCVEPPS